jgi:hypothetical protein
MNISYMQVALVMLTNNIHCNIIDKIINNKYYKNNKTRSLKFINYNKVVALCRYTNINVCIVVIAT